MAYPNTDRPNNRPQGGFGYRNEKPAPKAPPEALPEDYVQYAEDKMQEHYTLITTSKIRNMLSMLMDVFNTESLRLDETLSEESAVKLQLARIRIAYECGRDPDIKLFVENLGLLSWLKKIGQSRAEALRYIHYLEALVAYHRYYGGRES